jgi:ribonuclease HI
MTLERIPNKIISQLRRLSFNFLWNDLAGKRRFHLCSWQTLSRPKRSGGWGLKNLAIFNTTLLANSFWRAVTLDSIWHRVIMDKYIGSQPLHLWLRKTQLLQKRASPFWRGLVSSSPVILHWLRWWPGSGSEIKLGRDKLLGLDDRSILSLPLRSQLGSFNFFSLAQMKVETRVSPFPDRWLHSRDFPLFGSMAREWDSFSAALKQAGISLTEARDALIWAGGDATGRVTVKNIYVALLPAQDVAALPPWLFQMWKWPIPLKLILFIWLCANEKALTWEVLRKKGWHGPGFCYLCRRASEDIHHLLIHCTFTKEVWNRLLQHFSLPFTWTGATIADCFSSWYSEKAAPLTLAALVCWQIWTERNKALFEDAPPSSSAVFHRTLATFHWQPSTVKALPYKAVDFILPEGHTLVCFDGAARSSGLCCGAGGTFKSHPSRITKWFINCGEGTNTKAELMGLWASLTLASLWSLNHLLVLGDSRVIIDWINQISNLQSITLKAGSKKRSSCPNSSLISTSAISPDHIIPRRMLSPSGLLAKWLEDSQSFTVIEDRRALYPRSTSSNYNGLSGLLEGSSVNRVCNLFLIGF